MRVKYILHNLFGEVRHFYTKMVERKREDIIILSIQPKFAQQIFSGEKKYEFRKPPLPDELSYVVLVENGTRRILGGFRVGDLHEEKVEDLWRDFGKPISEYNRFKRYYEGWETGVAIEVQQPDEFEEPIPLEEITHQDDGLQVPNQFSYVYPTKRSLQILSQHSDIIQELFPVTSLTDWVEEETNIEDRLNLRQMNPEQEDHFRELFQGSGVPEDYDDIDKSFLEHILKTHKQQNDPYGYFTDKKVIYTFLKDDEPVGYTVTTWKIGNSVKYGPTILGEEHRGQGLGPRFRQMVDEELKKEGVRKAYSTIPDDKIPAYKYLRKSGYQVEAHMKQQYSEEHSELVFGKLLHGGSPGELDNPDRKEAGELEFAVGSSDIEELSKFVVESMAPWYENIGKSFVASVVEAEDRDLEDDLSKKGKRIYVGHSRGTPKSAVIASKKRGGGVKISPFLTDVLGSEVEKFLGFVEEDLEEELEDARKLYTHVPLLDADLVELFRTAGYQPEGLLREPYKDGIDMVFLGKLMS